MQTEIKKALRKQSCKDKKRHARDADSDSNSDNSTWRGGSGSTGEFTRCKKRELNKASKNYLPQSE